MHRSPWDWALAAALVLACSWSALLVAAPTMGRPVESPAWSRALAASAYVAGSLLCHQRPERSFHVAGGQVPVCARCSGLYWSGTLALALVALSAWTWGRDRAAEAWRRLAAHARTWLIVAAIPTALTLMVEWTGWAAPSNALRAAAALPLGLAAGLLVGQTLSFRGKL